MADPHDGAAGVRHIIAARSLPSLCNGVFLPAPREPPPVAHAFLARRFGRAGQFTFSPKRRDSLGTLCEGEPPTADGVPLGAPYSRS